MIGQSLHRLEDARFLTGTGCYLDDITLPGMLHATIVRSPHAHADITGIDVSAARTAPGVHGVFTAADLAPDQLGSIACADNIASIEPMIVPHRPALAATRVRHVGEPVSFVIAETMSAARDAAELVLVDYAPLEPFTDPVTAMTEGTPQLWPEMPGNLSYRFQKGDRQAVEAAFAQAAHIIGVELINNRLIVAPIETRGAIATIEDGVLHLIVSGSSVHDLRDAFADIFHLAPTRVRVSTPDVGGGFGIKSTVYPEHILLLWAARHLGRPVKWVADRSEDFISAAQGRDNQTKGRLALDADGRFLAMEVANIANLGAYVTGFGPGTSTTAPSTAMGGPYAIPAIFMDVRGVVTNTLPIDAYRGAGKPEANYLTERLIDAAARKLRIDPFELRRRNLIATFPHRTALGMTIDTGRFVANLDTAEQLADRAGFCERRATVERQGRLRGMGVACYLETARGQPNEAAEIHFNQDGTISLLVGTHSTGTGHETAYPQIAAELLGLPVETFRYIQGDTGLIPTGGGHGGARSMHLGGTAMAMAATEVLEKARPIAARLLQTSPDQLSFDAGTFTAADGRSVTLLSVAKEENLDTRAENICALHTFPGGCHVAEVEVDPETGAIALERYFAVDDFGRLINPTLTAAQVQGGVTQGIGQALMERTAYDPASGQLLSGSFMDYAIPRAADLPTLDVTLAGQPTIANRLGVKGSGQAGAIASPQTIVTAVLDALAPLGVAHFDMPITPETVWRAVQSAPRV
jgi:aerobic carbon-monoxide dehydrogenase large subunit